MVLYFGSSITSSKRIPCPRVSNPHDAEQPSTCISAELLQVYRMSARLRAPGPCQTRLSVITLSPGPQSCLAVTACNQSCYSNYKTPSRAVIFIMSFRASTHAGLPFQIAFYWFRLTARSSTHRRIAPTLMLSEWYW